MSSPVSVIYLLCNIFILSSTAEFKFLPIVHQVIAGGHMGALDDIYLQEFWVLGQ